MLLLLKLILTPLLIGSISVAERRFGPAVSGWLVGLPLTSAPVALFLALEQGTAFASRVAQGTLMGIISQAAFCVVYAWLSFRVNWLGCWLAGWGVFFTATFVFTHISPPLPLAFVGVVGCLLVVLLLWPRQRGQVAETKPPAWDIAGRMLVATGFVLGLTGVAPVLGPRLSGLLSPLPIFATIFAVFTHHLQGATVARQVLHGVVISSFACAVFFLVVAGLLTRWGVVATFSVALVAALLTQGCALWVVRKGEIDASNLNHT
jgi:hypothetical protein